MRSGTPLATREAMEQAVAACVARVFGVPPVAIAWLPGQLGLRAFARVSLRGAPVPTVIARVEQPEDPAGRPPGIPPEPPLEPIRALLERNGLPVPRCFGADEAGAITLLEDAGDVTLADVAGEASPGARAPWYREACDGLARLQRVAPSAGVEAFGRVLDAPYFAYKAELFCEHALAIGGRAPRPGERDVVRRAFAAIGRLAEAAPRRLAHRDFQSRNLLVGGRRPDGSRLTWIDLQGALLAPPEYDLACLLCDSYVALADDEIAQHLEHARGALPEAPDAATFGQRFDALTLTRKGKDLARFLYVARERGDRRFLAFVPNTLRHLRRAARRTVDRDPSFAPLAEILHALPEPPCVQ